MKKQQILWIAFLTTLLAGAICPAQAETLAKLYENYDGKGAYLEARQRSESLSGRWNDVISSVWVAEGCTLTLYENTGFRGKRRTLRGTGSGSFYNLKNFNDITSSYKIVRNSSGDNGTSSGSAAVFYKNFNRSGSALRAGEGRESRMNSGWNDTISSVWVSAGYVVTIYENEGFKGSSRVLRGGTGGRAYNLNDFNDRVSSWKVRTDRSGGGYDSSGDEGISNSGTSAPVIFYRDYNGQGNSFEPGTGRRSSFGSWNDAVSSVRVGDGYTVILYEHENYGGAVRTLTGRRGGTLYNLRDFNDRASSCDVRQDSSYNEDNTSDATPYEPTFGNAAYGSAYGQGCFISSGTE